jgi:hypothetical protein
MAGKQQDQRIVVMSGIHLRVCHGDYGCADVSRRLGMWKVILGESLQMLAQRMARQRFQPMAEKLLGQTIVEMFGRHHRVVCACDDCDDCDDVPFSLVYTSKKFESS